MKQYRKNEYDCVHYAVEKYEQVAGRPLPLRLCCDDKGTYVDPSSLGAFRAIETPRAPCLVVMRGVEVHLGVFDGELVWHMDEGGEKAAPLHIVETQHGKAKFYEEKR